MSFAHNTPERRKEIAQLGGRTAWAAGRANSFNSETARAAARKSVAVRRAKREAQRGEA